MLSVEQSLLPALVAPTSEPLHAWLGSQALDEPIVHWLQAQGLLLYAYARLEQAGLCADVPPHVLAAIRTYYYNTVALTTVQRLEGYKALQTLSRAGIEGVLLKGIPLAYTVYPQPTCRISRDLDIWIRPPDLSKAITVLQKVGYVPAGKNGHSQDFISRYGGEFQMRHGAARLDLLELQWPALRGEWNRRTANIDHAGIWSRRVPVRIEDESSFQMAPEDMLIHLCVHEAIGHKFSVPWLRSLLDIHLVIQNQKPVWETVMQRAGAWRLSVVLWTVLDLTARILGTPVPAAVLSGLSPSPARQWAIRRLHLDRALLDMWPISMGSLHMIIPLLLTDRPRDAWRLCWRALFPESDWLRLRYDVQLPHGTWRARLMHPWRMIGGSWTGAKS